MSQKDLQSQQAVEKLQQLAEGIDFCMMSTDLDSKPSHIIPMSTKDVDQDGCIWFLSGRDSTHNANILKQNDIQLIYAQPSDMEYLTLYGTAQIFTDVAIIRRYYSSSDDAWFNGVTDPNVSAIKVTPKEAYYWDTKNGKLTTFLKMGIGAVTGKQQDLGEEGNLNL
ncbi:MAG: pyridoxamine 5'-phosphate oxidase family protein [Nonlabens sp.]